MNRARTTTTTETYTAHYNLSRTSEGAALKGPIKIWNPQPQNLLSESETESAPKRHHSHAHIAQSVPSAHQAATNYSNYPPMSNSRSASSSYPHQRVSSPAPRRSERNAYVHPMEPSQPQPKPNTSVWNLNFIRPHRKEPKPEISSSRRGDDLHRTAVTSSRHHQSSASNANPVARGPAPPVSYSSPSSAEPSPRSSTDSGHQTSNNVSEAESRRHHSHTIWNPYVDSKLSSDYPARRPETVSSARVVDKKSKDREDMVAKVTEAFSPPMTSRSRVPETISLGQLSLLRGDDPNSARRVTTTGRASESQSRPQAHPPPSIPSQPRQRVPSQDLDTGAVTDSRSKNYRQPTSSTPRPPAEPPVRTQPTPTIPSSRAQPPSLPTQPQPPLTTQPPLPTKTQPPPPIIQPPPLTKTQPPPPTIQHPVSTRTPFFAHLLMKKNQPSSRAASGPPPYQALATEQATSKQSSKESSREPSTRSVRTPTASHPANPQVYPSNSVDHRPQQSERYATYPTSTQFSKVPPRDTGPPVPPKQVVSNILPVKSAVEEIGVRNTNLYTNKTDASRPTGSMDTVNQARHLYTSSPPPPPVSSAIQYQYPFKSKPASSQPQVQAVLNQNMVTTADLQIKSPIIVNQTATKPLPLPVSSTTLVHVPPVSAPIPSYPAPSAVTSQQMQVAARPSAIPKLPTPPRSPPPIDLALALVPIDKTVTSSKLHERLPILENQVQPSSESLDDMDRLALVRSVASASKSAPTALTKEEPISAGPTDFVSVADTVKREFILTVPITTTTTTSHSQTNNDHTTAPETITRPTSVHIQWIPPAETETSSISSTEEDEIISPRRFTNAVSHASVAAGMGTAFNKPLLRPGETSYASQAPNLYVVPQSFPRSNPPTPPEPGISDVPTRNPVPTEVPKKTPLSSSERLVAGAWTTKATASMPSGSLETLPKLPAKVENGVSFSRQMIPAKVNGDTVNGRLLSLQAAAVTTNGSSVGMTPGAWTTVAKYNKSTTIFESEKKNELYVGNGVSGNGQTMSSTMQQALGNSTSTVGTWTTKVAQLDAQYSHHSDTTPPKLTPPHNPSPPSATPKYQTTPATGSGSNTPSSSQSHTAGEVVPYRVPISGHPSTPAPSRTVLGPTPPPLSISSTTPDTDSLLTPSSLNSPKSTLLPITPTPPPAPQAVTMTSPRSPLNKEESSKNRILDLFRSKPTTTSSSNDAWVFPKQSSKEEERRYEEKKAKELPVPSFSQPKAKPIAIAPATQSLPPFRPKSPRLFSSLKLFSKRNRTTSTASMDALDGTTTTVMNSPSSSAPDIPGAPPSPPVRDALLATQEWRNNETNQLRKGKRPHKPGVTFDCPEDIAPIHMVPARFKLSRSSHYDVPPQDDITLEDFELWAIDRMRILAEIEASFARNRSYKDMSETILALSRKYLPLNSTTAKSIDVDAERKKDHISHFVLRLAFCRSEELRYRFVKSEMTWFRIKWDGNDATERSQFVESLKLGWIPVKEEERISLLPELLAASQITLQPGTTINQYTESYYKVHWTKVPDLVERRRVFLKNGWAYVPAREQASIVFQAFYANLENQMMLTAKALPRLDEDNRILPVLENLSQGFVAGIASEYHSASSGDSVTADMVDELSNKHFPLCMKNLHETLRKKHHLKHYGRLQYGLFLKGLATDPTLICLKVIGLSVEEAMIFWRKGFSAITDDKFNKEYKYNIRHSYGLEGKRTNYSAFSCQYIFTNHQPGVDDTHGCPYRHFSTENLESALVTHYGNQGVTPSVLPEIIQQVKSGHYHVACTRVFEITHGLRSGEGVGDGVSVTHPNEYVARSRELERQKLAPVDSSAMELDS